MTIEQQNYVEQLERKLKVTEDDRDVSKYIMGTLVANCMTILEKDNIDEIKEIVKETIHKCAEYTKEHM
jgi:chromosome condensin MukBEF ATPase and DNA-binding subunit MukB